MNFEFSDPDRTISAEEMFPELQDVRAFFGNLPEDTLKPLIEKIVSLLDYRTSEVDKQWDGINVAIPRGAMFLGQLQERKKTLLELKDFFQSFIRPESEEE